MVRPGPVHDDAPAPRKPQKRPTLFDELRARGSLKHLKSRNALFRECWARSCESQCHVSLGERHHAE